MGWVTLILNRKTDDLWLQRDGCHFEVILDVTGVKRKTGNFKPVKVLRKGKTISIIWYVEEIRERWG